MKRLIILLLLFATSAYGQSFYRYENFLLNQNGQPIPGVSVFVCTGQVTPNYLVVPPCPLANIFSDVSGTLPITQPTTTSPLGNYAFTIAPGVYTVVFTGQSVKASDIITIPVLASGATFTATNALVGGTQHEFVQSLVNGCNPQTETAKLGFPPITDALTACLIIPVGASTYQVNGLAGIISNSSTTTNAVGVFGQNLAKANSTKNWGANFVVGEEGGLTSHLQNLGVETDALVNSPASAYDSVYAYTASLVSNTAQSGTYPGAGYYAARGSSAVQWGYGFQTQDQAVATAAFLAGATCASSGTCNSQPIQFNAYTSGVPKAATILATNLGDLALVPQSGRNVQANAPLFAAGTVAGLTGTGACATITTQHGGSWAGDAKCTGATAASTLTITPGTPAPTGWVCQVQDETTRANLFQQTSHTQTTCVLTVTSVTQNDVFVFTAVAY